MPLFATFLRSPSEHGLLAAMLLLLHFAIWSDFGDAVSRSLMLAHLGVFLLWQPIWRPDRHLERTTAAIFLIATLVFVAWINWWFVFFWLLLLIGLIGGRVFVGRRERLAYLLVLLVLMSEFLIGCLTPMFGVSLPKNITLLFYYGLMLPPVLLLLIPASPRHESERAVDFLYGLTTALLTALLGIGTLLLMYTTGRAYPVAMFETLLTLALFLFAMSWLLTPHPGFSGLAQLWARYLLNISTPFESWLTGLAGAARREPDPESFLEAAMGELERLPWVEGATWDSSTGRGHVGTRTRHAIPVQAEDLRVTVHALRSPTATLVLHSKLLVQVVAYYYFAKRAQRELAQRAHVQAVYETGARVTHDIKNLLQSLYTMGTAVTSSDRSQAEELQALLKRQLPHVTQRLQLALDKLQAPADTVVILSSLADWWDALRARHAGERIEFSGSVESDREVPTELLESVSGNLLENARVKRQEQPGLAIRIALAVTESGPVLRICDTGTPLEAGLVERLFREPVASRTGLGIGLYQAARQAEQLGYCLRLASNEPGAVCFELAPTAPGEAPASPASAAPSPEHPR